MLLSGRFCQQSSLKPTVRKVGTFGKEHCQISRRFIDSSSEVPDTEFPHENRAGTSSSIEKKYLTFDVFLRGHREARSCVLKICSAVSLTILGIFALKRSQYNLGSIASLLRK